MLFPRVSAAYERLKSAQRNCSLRQENRSGWRRSARVLRMSKTPALVSPACTHAADATLACTRQHTQTQTRGRDYHPLHACMCTSKHTGCALERMRSHDFEMGGWEETEGPPFPRRERHILLGRGVPDGGRDEGGADCLHFLLAMRLFLVASMS